MKDACAVVGIGSTPYYRRGQSLPQTTLELGCRAIQSAVVDAGLSVDDIDGFAYYRGGMDTGAFAQALGIPEIRFSAALTAGGNGSAGSIGLAAAAIETGHAQVVVSIMSTQQAQVRFGAYHATHAASAEAIS